MFDPCSAHDTPACDGSCAGCPDAHRAAHPRDVALRSAYEGMGMLRDPATPLTFRPGSPWATTLADIRCLAEVRHVWGEHDGP